jgi:predicted nucleic acid-binding protein
VNYFDTSALIKAFLVEVGTDTAKQLLLRGGMAATATITYAEMYSGFSRKKREGGLTPKHYDAVCEAFESYWPACVQVELTKALLTLARDLMQRHPLRAFDAIHVASALSLKQDLGEALTIIAADERLLQAAKAEQLRTVDVERVQNSRGSN